MNTTSKPETQPARGAGAAPTGANSKLLTVLATAFMPLFFMVLLTTSFVSAQHHPAPHDFALVLAGPQAVTQQAARTLAGDAGSGFKVATSADADNARSQVKNRDAAGAIVIGDQRVTIIEATAGGSAAAGVVRQVGQRLATELGLTVTVDDVAPTIPGDANGTVLFLLLTTCTVGAFLCVVGPAQVRPKLRTRRMLVSNAIAALAIPAVAYAILNLIVGGFGLESKTLAALLGAAALYTLTVGLLATFSHQIPGTAGVLLIMVCAVALNLPSAGGSVPASMLEGEAQSAVNLPACMGTPCDGPCCWRRGRSRACPRVRDQPPRFSLPDLARELHNAPIGRAWIERAADTRLPPAGYHWLEL